MKKKEDRGRQTTREEQRGKIRNGGVERRRERKREKERERKWKREE